VFRPYLQEPSCWGGAELNRYRRFIIVVTAILTVATWVIMYRTSIGTQVRAIIRNPKMARLRIDVARINAMTFPSAPASPRRRCDDVRLQDGLSGYGHTDGG